MRRSFNIQILDYIKIIEITLNVIFPDELDTFILQRRNENIFITVIDVSYTEFCQYA